MLTKNNDEYWMREALTEAKKAISEDEIPVGAVLVKDGLLLSSAHNKTRQLSNPTAHCEKLIIDDMIERGEKYLYKYTLYVTLEPCSMCAGMIVLSRIGRVVFGCYDPKSGAVGSIYNIPCDKQMNHNPQITGGVLADECAALLKQFFALKR